MTKYLVTFKHNWADEFDAEGFSICDEIEKQNILENAKNGVSFYFGTNEGWEDGEDISSGFNFEPITDEEEQVLRKLFPSLKTTFLVNGVVSTFGEFGQFPDHYKLDFSEEEE